MTAPEELPVPEPDATEQLGLAFWLLIALRIEQRRQAERSAEREQ